MAQFLGEGASWTEWHFALHGDGTDLSGARETWPKGEVGGGEVQKRAGQTSVGLLACAAARAFACSLLEKRVSGGVDGDTPSVQVLGECRFAGLEAA